MGACPRLVVRAGLTGVLLLGLAAVLLVVGAEMFVENAAAAARRLGVTVLAVGVLLAGAEPEEMITAVLAALRDRPDLAAGDAIGANLTMFTAALGLAALARPLPVGPRVRLYGLAAAATGGLGFLVLFDGAVTRVEGALLLLAYGVVVVFVWWREKVPPALGELAEMGEQKGADEKRTRSPGLGLVLALLGIGLMIVGGNVAVGGAVRVVDALGATDTAVGLTLLALATTAELFALAFAAFRHGVGEIAVAGVVGSAAYNATATLGAAALARPLEVTGMTWPAAASAALPLVVLALAWRGALTRLAGLVLCAAYVAFVVVALA